MNANMGHIHIRNHIIHIMHLARIDCPAVSPVLCLW